METNRTCPQCQQPLSADAPDGLCPQCLMLAASGPPPSAAGVGLPGDIIDIGDPAEVAKKLPQFEILEMLGRGGMGVVYKARQVQLDRLVAVKILPPVDALSADFVARFTREARALAKLNHPNIVNVHDFGETGGLYFIVMEYVDGANLRQLFEARKLTPAEALAIVPKICDALQYAHEEGLVHRDIKPENLLIDKKGRVKIADFGLAKLLRREALDMTLTLSGMALGTLRYMAPEQMDKPETVDHRADLYSLGVVIYEMLTGETPVGRYELPSQKAQVDVRFDEIVLHALEREPSRRYQHASEVRDDVENVTSKPTATPVKKARAGATSQGEIFPVRFWGRDWLDHLFMSLAVTWLLCVFLLLPALVINALAMAGSPTSHFGNLALMGGVFVLLAVMAVFTAGSVQSVRVDNGGLTFNRFIGPSEFLPWSTIGRIEPVSRWEVMRHVFMWPGLPPRASWMCGTTLHFYRFDGQSGSWYFSPRHIQPFLAAIERSPLGSGENMDTENVTCTPKVAQASTPPRHLLAAFLVLLCLFGFFFGFSFQAKTGGTAAGLTQIITVGALDPLFIRESGPSGFQTGFNFFSWSFFAVVVAGIAFGALWRIGREDRGKVPRDSAWWRDWWKQVGIWGGLLLIACVVRTVKDPAKVLQPPGDRSVSSQFTKLLGLSPEPTIRLDRSQIPSVATPGRTDYAYTFSAPPNHRLVVWLEWWKEGKLTVDHGFNDGVAPARGKNLAASLHLTFNDGKVASPATAGQKRIDWSLGDSAGTATRGDWRPDFFAGMSQTDSWGSIEQWTPRIGETIILLGLRGGTKAVRSGPITDEGLRAGHWEAAMVLKARFEPVPASRLKEGPQMQGNAYRPGENAPEPGPALLRLAEQFGAELGPFVTESEVRWSIGEQLKKSPEKRAKMEQILREMGVPFSPDEKPEALVRKLEGITENVSGAREAK